MSHNILILKGDGIGPEVVDVAVDILKHMGLDLNFSEAKAGYACYQEVGDPIPQTTIAAARAADATLFGAVTTPPDIPNYRSAVVTLRRELDLYANLRPVHSLGLTGGHYREGLDFYVVRENTEGLYIGQEEDFGDYAIAKRLVTKKGSERIVRYAYELARRTGKRKVTVVHKANILRLTDGLFRRTALAVAKEYAEQYGIEVQELLVDTMAMRLIKDPQNFEVIVTTNLFGDILSDEAAELVGGLGVAASGNIGEHGAIFEPVHGSAPDIAGKGIANPFATLLATVMMLQHIGENAAAEHLQAAVAATIRQGTLTPDLGGTANTARVKEQIISNL
ncbi:isocitrate/isopropylmalate dehydrogenase family protein [Candidatus Chlorohelix sp.]|uniref:isocitrate/isopropylmalate dehydrogenase family protein n=1 Tax=Candidatus Chlorohelix sp. TaxID=3139201 RepID=UPI0030363ECE